VEVVALITAAAELHIHNARPFVEVLQLLTETLNDVVIPLEQVRDIFVQSAMAQAELGKAPSRSTVNLRHFTVCAMVRATRARENCARAFHAPTTSRTCETPPLSRAERGLSTAVAHRCRALHV